MKPVKQSTLFDKPLPEWLAGQSVQQFFLKLLALCDSEAIYIVDKDQKVLHWSDGAEKLTGFSREEIAGKPCLPECVITNGNESIEQLITLSKADGNKIQLKKWVQVLQDKTQGFTGGLGRLLPYSEQSPIDSSRVTRLDSGKQSFQGLLSRSPAMQAVFQIIENAAETTATVLVRGESGSGKELVAKAIHDLSGRRDAPFLAINCAALSSSLLESELFGHVRGAFTGAIKDHNGLFQRAHGGTLFLDEVAELPLELQAKLLRVIQERNYIPVGGDHSINVDVRIVAATHRSLREEVKSGHFREDLMYRLRVVPIFIPPLRDRREDISLLLWHFIHQHNADNVRKIEKIEPQAMRILLDYAWPGNIRELHNVVEYAFAVGRGATLRCSELPPEFREPRVVETRFSTSPLITERLTTEQEAAAIRQALETSNGKITPAARLLGMSRATFWRKRKLYGSVANIYKG
jgi:transcriptional regulator with PAS, ATPase and Fis domain